jgi:nucleoside-diphosphate-sugar epimerase
MGKTAVVTGGAGFIGSHLCEALIKENFKVICIDNLGTGKLSNLKSILNNKNFKFIKKDIREKIKIKEKIDFIFHLASYASPPYYQKYAIDTLMTNSFGTYNILELARQKRAKFLLASTSEVYGDPKIHPQKEEYWGNVNPVGVRSCYDEAKRFAEALTMEYSRKFNLNIRIIRIFNTYGPRLQKDDGRVISNFIYQALNNLPVTIYGDGTQTRSFCYVSDMIDGILKAMFVKNTRNQIINLGSLYEFTIKEAAMLIKKMLNSKSKIIYKPIPKDDPTRRRPDITKARKLLNWQPRIKLEQGLLKTIDWFKNEK